MTPTDVREAMAESISWTSLLAQIPADRPPDRVSISSSRSGRPARTKPPAANPTISTGNEREDREERDPRGVEVPFALVVPLLRPHDVVEPRHPGPHAIQKPRLPVGVRGSTGSVIRPPRAFTGCGKNPNRSYTRFTVFADTSRARRAPVASTPSSSAAVGEQFVDPRLREAASTNATTASAMSSFRSPYPGRRNPRPVFDVGAGERRLDGQQIRHARFVLRSRTGSQSRCR